MTLSPHSDMPEHGQLTFSSLGLALLAGIMAAVGLVSEPAPQLLAFVAAGFVGPGFEFLAHSAQALLRRDWPQAARSMGFAVATYLLVVLAAYLTIKGLLAAESATIVDLVTNPAVASLRFPGLKELLLAGAGAAAGCVLLASGRPHLVAGPLSALGLLPAAALVGAGLAAGRTTLAWDGLMVVLADFGLVLLAGLLVLGLKGRFKR